MGVPSRYCISRYFLFCAFLCLPPGLGASFNSRSIGTTGAEFLRFGAGARALAMGEAYTAVADDASAVFWNPGGLVQIPKASLTFMHAKYLADIDYDHISYAQRISRLSILAAAVNYMDLGEIERTDRNNLTQGTFHPTDVVYSLTYARDLDFVAFESEQFGFGVNFKWIHSRIVDSAGAYAFDVGVFTTGPWLMGRNLNLGAVIQNVGDHITFDQNHDPLPLEFKLGGAFSPVPNSVVSLNINFPRSNNPTVALGGEISARFTRFLGASARAGFNSQPRQGFNRLSGLTGFSGGGGISAGPVNFDYAFIPFGELGDTHRFSVTFQFPGKLVLPEETVIEIQRRLLEP